jgi:hypothetical protein
MTEAVLLDLSTSGNRSNLLAYTGGNIKSRGRLRKTHFILHHILTRLSKPPTSTLTSIPHLSIFPLYIQNSSFGKSSVLAESYATDTLCSTTSSRTQSRCLPALPLPSRPLSSPHQLQSVVSHATAAVATSPAGASSCRLEDSLYAIRPYDYHIDGYLSTVSEKGCSRQSLYDSFNIPIAFSSLEQNYRALDPLLQ